MYTVRYGGKRGKAYRLAEGDDLLAVRTHSRNPVMTPQSFEVAALSEDALAALAGFERVARFALAGVELLRFRRRRGAREARDRTRAVLKREGDVRFAGRALCSPRSRVPVLYTENLFVKLDDDEDEDDCLALFGRHGLTVKRALPFARNAYFVAAAEGTGLAVFELAERLLGEAAVELCHPELVREARPRAAFPQQWHLKATTIDGRSVDAHASVEAAWALSEGDGTVIAVIDDGVDVDHEELGSPGKIVAPRNASLPETLPNATNPRPGSGANHGTACAGVACAGGRFGASGVAPRARLMPIRLVSGLGSMAEADAFYHAANHGAGVVSCSWGPADGRWWDPSDPTHNHQEPLPDSTRTAIDWAVRNGRNGKGCVVVWAAGNGNESVENDGYASYEKVLAVAACNDSGTKSAYSDFGPSIWCAFPSNHGRPSKTRGIWTTDRSGGAGYNPGETARGDPAGNYTNGFGGTSSAAPGVAGVAALVLARNPALRWDQVREVLRQGCDRIDPEGGDYDGDGHSPIYGYGRINARRAVELALPAQPDRITRHTAIQDVAIKDYQTSKLAIEVAESRVIRDLRVHLELEHTYIGDLICTLRPPPGTGVQAVTLHDREGGGTDNLKRDYDTASTAGLRGLVGTMPAGTWTLSVQDRAGGDTGTIRSFTVELVF